MHKFGHGARELFLFELSEMDEYVWPPRRNLSENERKGHDLTLMEYFWKKEEILFYTNAMHFIGANVFKKWVKFLKWKPNATWTSLFKCKQEKKILWNVATFF